MQGGTSWRAAGGGVMTWQPQVQTAIFLRQRGWRYVQAGGRKQWRKGKGDDVLTALNLSHAYQLETTLIHRAPLTFMWGRDIAEMLGCAL